MGRDRDSDPDERARELAIEMYEGFHQMEPTVVGRFGSDVAMPRRARRLGRALHVLYRSSKIDPETGRRPRGGAQNYIHEHDAGVGIYKPVGVPAVGPEAGFFRGGEQVDVPGEISHAKGLVLLGECLGLKYETGAEAEDMGVDFRRQRARGVYELESRGKGPELYAIPSGKALVIVRDQREILYVVWGGGLGVEPRGIVG